MKPRIRNFARDYLPPAAVRLASGLLDSFRGAAFQYVGSSWPRDLKLEGWAAEGVQDNREQTWRAFRSSIEDTTLLGISEASLRFPGVVSIDVQSLYLAYGYCLGLACRTKSNATVLDWGGSVGNYYLIARRLFPEVAFEYTSVDLPAACAAGRKLLSDVTFCDDSSWQSAEFDFVFSSSSLQYLEDWRPTVAALVQSSKRYLYITRMPFVISGKSFVALQRVKEYKTEYPGWILNRDEFVSYIEKHGMKLRTQFVNHGGPRIKDAPEENLYMGFLFER
jgi:putative methyltransferase (TIGR04325 family)